MIPQTLRITLCIGVIVYFILILRYLKLKMLELKYTLIWLVAGLIMGVMVFFPELLTRFIRLLGIESNMNGLFILAIAFCIMVLMTLTSIASRTSMKMRTMIQEVAMLEKRVRELETENVSLDNENDHKENKGTETV
ncbi:MAG: DUF2304 domain-containing protein [Lachnospiraceae bacterium]|nr:DUF2304 domain-containing protein [Lachnospiraceae bacterium]